MRTHESRKCWILSGALLTGLCAALLTPQTSATAAEKAQPIAGPTETEIARIEAISSVFRKVTHQVRPAVVHIQAKSGTTKEKVKDKAKDKDEDKGKEDEKSEELKRLPEPFRRFFDENGRGRHPLFKSPDDLRKFFEDQDEWTKRIPRVGLGSGVIVDAQNGYVLTSRHVIEFAEPDTVTVFTDDNRKLYVEWIREDEKTDVAVLKLKSPKDLHELKLGDSDQLDVGDWVLAVGSPFGPQFSSTVTFGIVSAKGRSNLGLGIDYQDFIQTDAAINKGNSGGPLVNLRGEVVGINTAILSPTGMSAGIGFSVPANLVKWVMTQLIEHKKVVRGYLGVIIQSLEDQPGMSGTYGLESNEGVVVSDVRSGPAQKGGMRIDDVILELDGAKIANATDLQNRVAMIRPGTKAKFKIWRDRKAIELMVTIGEQPKDFRTHVRGRLSGVEPGEVEGGEIKSLGVTVEPLTETNGRKYGWKGDEGGLLITTVDPDSETETFLRLKAGDLIQAVNKEPVKTIKELEKATSEEALKKGVRIYVRDHQTGAGTNVYLQAH